MDFINVLEIVMVAGSVYVGIRADLSRMHSEVQRAHGRIDDLIIERKR
jgi:hypothetical protein